jgi:hypothetical protein
MFRDALIPLSLAALAVATPAPHRHPRRPSPRPPFTVVEASIGDMQRALASGRVTSRQIVTESFTRIARYSWQLNAVLAVNPEALDEADERDRERRSGHVRGPLHGIPIAVKDNIQTTDLPTTGGAGVRRLQAALRGDARDEPARGRRDRHREDGDDRAGQLGRRRADPMPANYSALGGYGSTRTTRAAIRARRPTTAGRHSRPAVRVPASAPPQALGSQRRHRRPPGRSSARRTRTCSSESSRPWAASAATA